MRINATGIAIIKHFEGLRLNAYLCPACVPTIGYGHTADVKLGQTITSHQADTILAYDLEGFEESVEHEMPGANENQFSACVSLAFNIGTRRFAESTLLKKFKAGDFKGAAAEFDSWRLVNGKVEKGLVLRRVAERTLFTAPVTP